MKYEVRTTAIFDEMFDEIGDRRAQGAILRKLEDLDESPELRGKPLTGPLFGLRRISAAGRYRIIYRVAREANRTVAVAVGIRKEGGKRDIYALTERLARYGLLKE